MTMSVHTFELKTQLSSEETKAVRDALYTYAKGKKDMCYPQNNRLYFNRWCDEGVRFFLESSASVPGSTLHRRRRFLAATMPRHCLCHLPRV